MKAIPQNRTRLASETSRPTAFDPLLITVYLALVVFGMIAVYSATIALAFETGDPFIYLRKNAMNIAIALVAMLITSQIPIYLLRKFSWLLLICGAVLLALVLIPSLGVEVNGSTRWMRISGFVFQPSEFAELMFLIFAADFLAKRQHGLNSILRDVLPIVAVYLVFAVLLLLEPDFGSAVVLGAVLMVMLYLNGLRVPHIALFASIATVALVALIVTNPYRVARVMSFLNPWADPYDSGFQLVQSLIALGRGEWFGVGLGTSVQKLFYLPYAGSDFLLAVIGEELGFVGICTVIMLFLVLIWKVFQVSWSAAAAGDFFSKNLAQAIAVLIAISAVINMGVNMGSLPTKGLTLPFMSEGGTSLVVYSIAIGLVISINRQSQRPAER